MSGTTSPTIGASRFDIAFAKVDQIEAGFVNNPADRGGATNHGVSLRFLVAEGKIDANHDGFADYDLNMDGDIDIADIKALTVADAKALFKRCFWDRLGCDALPAPLDAAVFDQGVNGGCVAAIKLLQSAISTTLTKRLGNPTTIRADGVIGPATMKALKFVLVQPAAGMSALLVAYRAAAADRYREIVAVDPSQSRFLNGWLRRAAELGL